MSELLDRPLVEARLPTRLFTCMNTEGCATLRDVVAKTEQELRRIPGLGKTSLNLLKQILADMGLELANRPARDGTLPLPFPSLHERLTRIEQRQDEIIQRLYALERHPLLREVGQMGEPDVGLRR